MYDVDGVKEKTEETKGMLGGNTNLRPHHLRQSPNELRCGIDVASQRFFIDDLTYCEPEGGFETLCSYNTYMR